MNNITIVGNLTKDPELRFLNDGTAKAGFGIAVNRRWPNKQTGEWNEETTFFDVVCWREMAEQVADAISKGTRVIVTGRLEQRSWQDEATGQTRTKMEVVADEVGPEPSLRSPYWRCAQAVAAGATGVPAGPLLDRMSGTGARVPLNPPPSRFFLTEQSFQ
jgi:single-strand DNA-binding protein